VEAAVVVVVAVVVKQLLFATVAVGKNDSGAVLFRGARRVFGMVGKEDRSKGMALL